MEKTIKIGDKELTFKSSAATNILYKRAFKEDVLVKLSTYTRNLKEMQNMKKTVDELKSATDKTEEEVLQELNKILASDVFISTQTFASETLPKLAFIMYLEANEKIGTLFTKLNEDNYLAWLMTIDQDELLTVTGEVMDIWQAGARTHSNQKN